MTKTKGFMQLSAYLAVDAAVAHLQAQEMTSPGVSAAHKFDHTPEIPLARAFQKMHCLKEGHDRRHKISMATSTQTFSMATSFPTGEENMTDAQFVEWCNDQLFTPEYSSADFEDPMLHDGTVPWGCDWTDMDWHHCGDTPNRTDPREEFNDVLPVFINQSKEPAEDIATVPGQDGKGVSVITGSEQTESTDEPKSTGEPESPEKPESPEVSPEEPESPKEPESLEGSHSPGESQSPGGSHSPEKPEEPESPGSPKEPESPEGSRSPGKSQSPGGSHSPEKPEEPESPGSPKEPESPEGSRSPEESQSPEEPVEETAPGLVQDEESIAREEHKTE
ncbi:hypothetical protein V502_00157, partial [Pseudogymnoascus sp. VKM F-4520 (FW-2644)]